MPFGVLLDMWVMGLGFMKRTGISHQRAGAMPLMSMCLALL